MFLASNPYPPPPPAPAPISSKFANKSLHRERSSPREGTIKSGFNIARVQGRDFPVLDEKREGRKGWVVVDLRGEGKNESDGHI